MAAERLGGASTCENDQFARFRVAAHAAATAAHARSKIPERINTLIADIARNANEGIGKPETLKHGFQGYWSRASTTSTD
ncbi:type II toxin-antitoxin system YoeB family toxin [Streptomyces sp. NPDC102395]|uniref:type II toxin-antitoxin system YoeB family toxin n=1 Tax=Streptomyces sp. NPDC102395 TaxID=3366168 RepID=UPI0037F417E8